MNKPELKRELVVEMKPDTNTLTVDVATPRALKWAVEEGEKYASNVEFSWLLRRATLPAKVTLIVSPCYDAAEVKAHLEYPEFTDAELQQ